MSETQVSEKPVPIALGENQELAPKDAGQLDRVLGELLKSESLPKHYKNIQQLRAAWNLAAQLKLPPQSALRQIAIIHGSAMIFGDLPLALAQRHHGFLSYEEFNIDENGVRICFENQNLKAKPWGGIVFMRRIGMDKAQSFSFTLDDAERAGLIKRAGPSSPWIAYQQVMLIRRARSIAIKALFADALVGAAIAEDFDFAPDLKDVTPTGNGIDKKKYLEENFGGNISLQETTHKEGQAE